MDGGPRPVEALVSGSVSGPVSGEALRGRTVFLTGHTGFMGSWLTLWLRGRGATVHGYALDPPTEPALFHLAHVRDALAADTRGDVRDAAAVTRACEAAHPDVVIHLAAQPLVRAGYREPAATFAVNVVGTANVLDAVRALKRPLAVVIASSDKCYRPHPDGRPHRESDRLGGHEPYAASKAGTELVVDAYRHAYVPPAELDRHGVQLASVRAGNAIGGGDWAEDRIVPDAVRAVTRGEPLVLRMPHAVRPWQHVLDPLAGYLRLVERMIATPDARWCRAWNFGPDDGGTATVGELVERFDRGWPGARHRVQPRPEDPAETVHLRLDASDARRELGWRPAWGWEEAVDRCVRWYRGADPRAGCDVDIAAWEGANP